MAKPELAPGCTITISLPECLALRIIALAEIKRRLKLWEDLSPLERVRFKL